MWTRKVKTPIHYEGANHVKNTYDPKSHLVEERGRTLFLTEKDEYPSLEVEMFVARAMTAP